MYQIKYSDGSEKTVDEFVLKEEIERNKINRPKFIKENGGYILLEASAKFANFCFRDRNKNIASAKKALKRTSIFFTLLLVLFLYEVEVPRFLYILFFIVTLISLNYIGEIIVNWRLLKAIKLSSPENKEFEKYIKVERILCKSSRFTLQVLLVFCIIVFVSFTVNIEHSSVYPFSQALQRLFLHGSALHFIGNLLGLAWVLKRLECLFGKLNTIIFLLFSIFINGLVNLYLLPNVIGFSGVILSLMGILLFVLLEYESKIHLYDLYFDLFYVIAVGLAGYQFISNEAHLYGFLIGCSGYWLYRSTNYGLNRLKLD
jgi:membrane associated rhomboid family serine protease